MSWFSKPYPQIEETKVKLAVALGMGMVCFLFLLIFKPFGIASIKESQPTFVLGFGLICSLVLLVFYFILPRLLPQMFSPENWNIRKEITFFIFVTLSISILNYFYNSTIGLDISPQHGFVKFIFITSAVGMIPIFLMTYITEKVARQRNESAAINLTSKQRTKELLADEVKLVLTSDSVKSESLEVTLDDFLFAQANGNYTDIYYSGGNNEVEHLMMRSTLKNIQNQLAPQKAVIRCHKSFLVNRNHIDFVSGNARSLNLKLRQIDKEIPVSRSFDRRELVL